MLPLQVCVNAIAVVPKAHTGPEEWLGLAVYSRAAMLNHACNPNAAASFDGCQLRLHALSAIAPSTVLRLCYGPQVQHSPNQCGDAIFADMHGGMRMTRRHAQQGQN